MQKTLPERVEYEQLGRDPPTEGRLVQGSLQLRFERDNHWRTSLDRALLSKDTKPCGRIATIRMSRMAELRAKIALERERKAPIGMPGEAEALAGPRHAKRCASVELSEIRLECGGVLSQEVSARESHGTFGLTVKNDETPSGKGFRRFPSLTFRSCQLTQLMEAAGIAPASREASWGRLRPLAMICESSTESEGDTGSTAIETARDEKHKDR
jgi:hypothetical protein